MQETELPSTVLSFGRAGSEGSAVLVHDEREEARCRWHLLGFGGAEAFCTRSC